jgi:hypothetical protein
MTHPAIAAARLAGRNSNVVPFPRRARRLDQTGGSEGPSEIDRIVRLVCSLHLRRELAWHDAGVIQDALIAMRGRA